MSPCANRRVRRAVEVSHYAPSIETYFLQRVKFERHTLLSLLRLVYDADARIHLDRTSLSETLGSLDLIRAKYEVGASYRTGCHRVKWFIP